MVCFWLIWLIKGTYYIFPSCLSYIYWFTIYNRLQTVLTAYPLLGSV